MLQRLTGFGVAAILLGLISISGSAMAAAPTITSVTPNLTDVGGGEVIEIRGTEFTDGALAVQFGGTDGTDGEDALNITVLSATLASVTTPATLTKGRYDVFVLNGTGFASLPNGITFTTHNRVLQVSVHMTIAQQVKIAWGAGTSNNDTAVTALAGAAVAAGDITPYTWYVRDPEFGSPAQINLGATYSTDGPGAIFTADTDNARTLNVINISQTGSPVDITAVCSHSVPDLPASPSWSPAAGAGTNTFQMEAHMIAAATGTADVTRTLNNGVSAAAQQLYDELPACVIGTEDPSRLHLQVSTPTATTITATTEHVVTVSLIGTAD